eukprot:210837_1
MKQSRSRSKAKHKQSNSGPLIAITSQKLFKRNRTKRLKDGRKNNAVYRGKCVVHPRIHKSSKTSTPIIDMDRTDITRASQVDISQVQTERVQSPNQNQNQKRSLEKRNPIVNTPHDHSYSHSNSRHLTHHVTLNNNGLAQ